jgi:hypothetical protein
MSMEAQSASSPGSSVPDRLNLLWDNMFEVVFTRDLPPRGVAASGFHDDWTGSGQSHGGG